MNKLRTCVQVLAIMAAAVTTFCLCQRDVTTRTMKTKRKKFMGDSCQVPRKVLEDLSLKYSDRKVSTLSGMEAEYLCYKCCNMLVTLTELEQKVSDVRATLLQSLGKMLDSKCLKRKRLADDDDDFNLKRIRLAAENDTNNEVVPATSDTQTDKLSSPNITVSLIACILNKLILFSLG